MIFSLFTTKGTWVGIRLYIFDHPSPYITYVKRPGQVTQDLLMAQKWHHFCVTINGTTNTMVQILVRRKEYTCGEIFICL